MTQCQIAPFAYMFHLCEMALPATLNSTTVVRGLMVNFLCLSAPDAHMLRCVFCICNITYVTLDTTASTVAQSNRQPTNFKKTENCRVFLLTAEPAFATSIVKARNGLLIV